MATCRDCLYQTICDVYSNLGVTDIPASDVSICDLFKAKADVAEVKHGEWVYKKLNDGYFHDSFYCSRCGREALFDRFCMGELSDFCPNCGAKMDGGNK